MLLDLTHISHYNSRMGLVRGWKTTVYNCRECDAGSRRGRDEDLEVEGSSLIWRLTCAGSQLQDRSTIIFLSKDTGGLVLYYCVCVCVCCLQPQLCVFNPCVSSCHRSPHLGGHMTGAVVLQSSLSLCDGHPANDWSPPHPPSSALSLIPTVIGAPPQ